MWLLPHGSSEHKLDLLTSGKTTDVRVCCELRLESEIAEHFLNIGSSQWFTHHTGGSSLSGINLVNHLLVTHLFELSTGQPRGLSSWGILPLNLVLVTLLQLTAVEKLLDRALDTLFGGHLLFLELGLFFLGQTINLALGFSVLSGSVTPLNVLVWSLIQMTLNMMESVLGNICHTQVRMLPHKSIIWLQLSGEKFDHGRLTSSVWSNTGNTGVERHLECDVIENLLVSSWITKVHSSHLEDSSVFGVNTLKESWLWKNPLGLSILQVVVGLGLWSVLDKLSQVSTVLADLASLIMNNTSAHLVQESRVVRHNDRCHVRQGCEVVNQPLDVGNVKMVCRLIQQHNISLHQHSTGQSKLHLPSSRESSHSSILHILGETNGSQSSLDFFLGDLLILSQSLIIGDEINDCSLSLGGIDVVLNIHSAELFLWWESIDLSIGNGSHQCGLSASVWSTETITLSTLQVKGSIHQKHLGTISKGEFAVAKILTFLLINLGLLLLGLLEADGKESSSHLVGSWLRQVWSEVWNNTVLPYLLIEVLEIHKSSSNSGDILEGSLSISSESSS
mmetsp:Transcript_3229/g.6472  ORF Transcript_3229/g.6472 Transcript_3229/m.6472 type:complete len:563 (+) Transcript_3229:1213-2901(+)